MCAVGIAIAICLGGCATGRLIERIQADVNAIPRQSDGSKSAYSERSDGMNRIWDGLSLEQRDAVVAVGIQRGAILSDASADRLLWGCVACDLIGRGRWDSLELVLENRAIDDVEVFALEWMIARRDIERLDVLCRAYELARSERVRDGIATALRRAFPSEGTNVCDRVLVGRCHAMLPYWKDRVVNDRYRYLPSGDGTGPEGLLMERE